MTNPIDNLNTQLPGRLLAVEALLIALLSQKSNAGKLIEAADTLLASAETETFQENPRSPADVLTMYTAARRSLDMIREGTLAVRAARNK
ncbi:MAG: hypothetical protein J0H71_05385 [Rhizobiales bacterium]|nr:hypothetical protein [Hyphomicrobiales bacterium]